MLRLTRAEVKTLLPWRTRGLDELKKRVGDISPHIDHMLKTQKIVTILELGCGFGTALIELSRRYGNRVRLFGINKKERHGDWTAIKNVAVLRKFLTRTEAEKTRPAKIVFCDVSNGLPFKSRTFDLVFSQVAFQYFDDKIHVIEEVNRVLKPHGIARMHIMFFDPHFPKGYQHLLEIWDEGKKMSLKRYLRKYPSVRYAQTSFGKKHLRMTRTKHLDLHLHLCGTLNVNQLDSDCWGTKSIYRVRH